MTSNSRKDGLPISIEKTPHQKRLPIYERVEDNAFHLHICELSCDVERAKLYSVSAPILERRAGCDLEFVIAGLAPNVILPVIAVAFANRLAVHEPDFPGDIHLI